MGIHEAKGQSDEWYTPKYIFDALQTNFDLDVCAPLDRTYCNVPAKQFITEDSLTKEWNGFVWMNPPWSSTKEKIKWISKFINHGNGIALMPDSTSAEWWQFLSKKTDGVLFTEKRVRFIKPDGSTGDNPANGTSLFAIGDKGLESLINSQINGLGKLYYNRI